MLLPVIIRALTTYKFQHAFCFLKSRPFYRALQHYVCPSIYYLTLNLSPSHSPLQMASRSVAKFLQGWCRILSTLHCTTNLPRIAEVETGWYTEPTHWRVH